LPDRSPGVLEVTDPAALAPAVLKRERVASRGSQPQALFVDDEEGRKHEAVRVENPSELGQVMHDVVFEHVREHRLEDDQIDSAVLDRDPDLQRAQCAGWVVELTSDVEVRRDSRG
jgi:hypothetical protein